jgi:hypothetical protein
MKTVCCAKLAERKRKTIHILDYQGRGYFQGLKSGKDIFENVRRVLRHIRAPVDNPNETSVMKLVLRTILRKFKTLTMSSEDQENSVIFKKQFDQTNETSVIKTLLKTVFEEVSEVNNLERFDKTKKPSTI